MSRGQRGARRIGRRVVTFMTIAFAIAGLAKTPGAAAQEPTYECSTFTPTASGPSIYTWGDFDLWILDAAGDRFSFLSPGNGILLTTGNGADIDAVSKCTQVGASTPTPTATATPLPTQTPGPTTTPETTPTVRVIPTPTATTSPETTPSPEPPEPTVTERPTATTTATPSPEPTVTEAPTATPAATATERPTSTPEPTAEPTVLGESTTKPTPNATEPEVLKEVLARTGASGTAAVTTIGASALIFGALLVVGSKRAQRLS